MPLHIQTPVLHTERLTLRPVTPADIPTVQREFARWNIIQHLSIGVPWPYPDDGAHHWFHHNVKPKMERKEEAIWAITKRESTDKLIGIIHIMDDDGLGNRGFWLAESEQGKGYMTEAANRVNDFVFTHTELTEVYVYNALSNDASRRVKEKSGAEFVRIVHAEHRSGETESQVWVYRKDAWLNRDR